MGLQSVDAGWDSVLRFLGVASVTLDKFKCPNCETLNDSWQVVGPDVLPATASMEDMESALKLGLPLCLQDLRKAIASPTCAPLPPVWQEAATSDNGFRECFQRMGTAACFQVAGLLSKSR